jgi:MarR family transcriptional regulator, transcriptional regulator for hemolysin
MSKQLLPQHEPIGLLLAAARRRNKQVVGERARPFGLSPQQFWSLIVLHERNGLSLRDLAERHRMDEPTASRVMAALTRRGLVSCETDPGDRRRCRLRLTDDGEALARQLRPLAQEVRRALVRGFTPAEREMLAAMLLRLIANMDWLADGGASAGGTRGPARKASTARSSLSLARERSRR